MKKFLSWFFIVSGILSFAASAVLFWQRTTPQGLSFDINENFNPSSVSFSSTPSAVSFRPLSLTIRDVGIYLSIYPASIEGGKWETTDKGVSYLVSSPIPGEIGNSIFYGHNWPNLLGNLIKVKKGQEIEIWFDNNMRRRFVVESVREVTPDQTHVLLKTDDKRVPIYTCIGFLDRKRFVVSAVLKEG